VRPRPLLADDLPAEPLVLFARWFGEARSARIAQPNAMTLATVDTDGRPSARLVLLKGADERGLRFFTNYQSPKAEELEAAGHAAVAFFWPELSRQVRARGPVERVGSAESDEYFATRERGTQLGAWASPQSRPLGSREELDARAEAHAREYAGRPVPRPPHWGGYRLSPDEWEFWSGRENRLHDRFRYARRAGGSWVAERLAP
jgi:pyridoxamine 5'-phosphate oxidase